MGIYYLFLDELKPNNIYKHFCLGGCIIEDTLYKKSIIPYINYLKNQTFGNTTIVLHENQISQKRDEFSCLKNNAINTVFWTGMKDLFANYQIKTMFVGIDYKKYCNIYKNKSLTKNSEYFIALQIILENFVHFLIENQGKGSVYIESRGIIDDVNLNEQYDTIKRHGTLFIESEIFCEKLKAISFPMKVDNNIGLQIADFIMNPIARNLDGINQKPLNLLNEIQANAYDGNNSLMERFGIKKVL